MASEANNDGAQFIDLTAVFPKYRGGILEAYGFRNHKIVGSGTNDRSIKVSRIAELRDINPGNKMFGYAATEVITKSAGGAFYAREKKADILQKIQAATFRPS